MTDHVISRLYHLGAGSDNDSDLFRVPGGADAPCPYRLCLSVIKSLDSLHLQNIQILIQLYFNSL
jgi:hypothetical protein